MSPLVGVVTDRHKSLKAAIFPSHPYPYYTPARASAPCIHISHFLFYKPVFFRRHINLKNLGLNTYYTKYILRR